MLFTSWNAGRLGRDLIDSSMEPILTRAKFANHENRRVQTETGNVSGRYLALIAYRTLDERYQNAIEAAR